MTKIDFYIVNYQITTQDESKSLTQIGIGSLLLILGIGITVVTFISGYSQFFFAYGAILFGFWYLKLDMINIEIL
jgi:uncharacterized membrane protein